MLDIVRHLKIDTNNLESLPLATGRKMGCPTTLNTKYYKYRELQVHRAK